MSNPFEFIGYLATAVFACSYFFKKQGSLRLVQALGAFLWIGYGLMIHAMPVIISNVVVAGIALTSLAASRGEPAQ